MNRIQMLWLYPFQQQQNIETIIARSSVGPSVVCQVVSQAKRPLKEDCYDNK